MKLVVFGLTVSSSWGNGHATLWRGLIRALERRGHDVVFFERDAPYYAEHRDLTDLGEALLVLYPDWESVRLKAMGHLLDADVAMVTSYCPDARAASDLIAEQGHVSVFYDLDTPVTLARLAAGETVDYLPPDGLGRYDLVLSYTGGAALERLRPPRGPPRPPPPEGHLAPPHHPTAPPDPRDPPNTWFVQHLPPGEHGAFFSSSRLTLNVTRRDMAAMGWCPSGRLFEAAACGAPILTDTWPGLEDFFTPGREVLAAGSEADVLAAMDLPDAALARIGKAGRERVLDEHTSDHRAGQLLALLVFFYDWVMTEFYTSPAFAEA